MKAKNVEEDTEEDVICKIGVIVDDNLYTLDDSAHNLVIADTSCSEDGHVKKVHFKDKEGSTCDSDLNTDSKEIDCSADTVELSTMTAKSVVQDITNEEELNDTVSAQDDDDLEHKMSSHIDTSSITLQKIRMVMSMQNQEMIRLTKLTKLLKAWKLLKEWNMRKPRKVRKVRKLVKVRKVMKLVKVRKVRKQGEMKMTVKQGNFTYFTNILKQLFCRSS